MQISAPVQRESMWSQDSQRDRKPQSNPSSGAVSDAAIFMPLSRTLKELHVLEGQELLHYMRSKTRATRKKL